MNHDEREVKIPLAAADACAAALDAAGARPLEPKRLEDDRLFDDAAGSLARADQVIRLRRKVPLDGSAAGTDCVLTYKGPARIEGGHRVREEIETAVEDAEALVMVLVRLGYRSSFRYQKHRRLYDWEGALIAVDETPLGDFLEIEGSAAAIEELSARLGHDSSEFLTASYPALWRAARGEEGGDDANDGGLVSATPRAMVLAAGQGSRLRPLTTRLAKPAVPFLGTPILTRLLDALGAAGVEEAVVNLHQAPDSIRRVVAERGDRSPLVSFSDETERLLDTAGALMPVRERFTDAEFFLVNGDCVHEVDLGALLAAHRSSGHEATLAVRPRGVEGFGSLLCDSGGLIETFGAPTEGRPGERHFLSVMILSPSLLEFLPGGELRPLKVFRDWFPRAVEAGCRFGTFVSEADWHAADTPARYLAATRDRLAGHDGGPWLASEAMVADSAQLDAGCAVHSGAEVAADARLSNTVLLEGARVGARARLEGCLLGPGATVEEGAELRDRLLVAEGWE